MKYTSIHKTREYDVQVEMFGRSNGLSALPFSLERLRFVEANNGEFSKLEGVVLGSEFYSNFMGIRSRSRDSHTTVGIIDSRSQHRYSSYGSTSDVTLNQDSYIYALRFNNLFIVDKESVFKHYMFLVGRVRKIKDSEMPIVSRFLSSPSSPDFDKIYAMIDGDLDVPITRSRINCQ